MNKKGFTEAKPLNEGGRRGSNPRHPEPQSGALPTELQPPFWRANINNKTILKKKKITEVSCCYLNIKSITLFIIVCFLLKLILKENVIHCTTNYHLIKNFRE